MKTNTRIAIAGLLTAAGSVLSALAAEFNGEKPQEETPAGEPTTTKKGRGKAAAAAPAKTSAPPTETSAEPEPEAPVAGAKTYDELKAMIKPLVEAAKGPEVKQIIAKYAKDLKELETKPQHHAAFEKDLEALSY